MNNNNEIIKQCNRQGALREDIEKINAKPYSLIKLNLDDENN